MKQKKSKEKIKPFSLADILKDKKLFKTVKKTDKKILAKWAISCVERVMPYFEKERSKDKRPKQAIKILQKWILTGKFRMKEIRKASLDSHAAARAIKEDNSAKSTARAAGQAVATAHVKTHSIGAANYALQAIYRDNLDNASKANKLIEKEKKWQYKQLMKLNKQNKKRFGK